MRQSFEKEDKMVKYLSVYIAVLQRALLFTTRLIITNAKAIQRTLVFSQDFFEEFAALIFFFSLAFTGQASLIFSPNPCLSGIGSETGADYV